MSDGVNELAADRAGCVATAHRAVHAPVSQRDVATIARVLGVIRALVSRALVTQPGG